MSKEIISGVYKITNLLTDEFYIGCSTNIYKRWYNHKNRYNIEWNKEYNKPLYVAFRKYGVENFDFSILEEVKDLDELFSREQFYIDSLKAYIFGYNKNREGENHGKAKLTESDVLDIRERYAMLESKRSVYYDYKHIINPTGFHKVWNGYTWKHVKMDIYTIENKKYHKNDTGSKGETNGRAKISNEDMIFIRKSKDEGKKINEIYPIYQDRLTLGSFKNVWYGYNWKNIT